MALTEEPKIIVFSFKIDVWEIKNGCTDYISSVVEVSNSSYKARQPPNLGGFYFINLRVGIFSSTN